MSQVRGTCSRRGGGARADAQVVVAADEARALGHLGSAVQEPADAVLVRGRPGEEVSPSLVRRLRAAGPGLAVLMVVPPDTAVTEARSAALGEAFAAGAAGLVTEDCRVRDMVTYAHRAVRGERAVSPRAAEVLIASVEGWGGSVAGSVSRRAGRGCCLSACERSATTLRAARATGVSPGTWD